MHDNSMKLMKYFADKYVDKANKLSVLDIGSKQYNNQCTYRELFVSYSCKYTGMDIVSGPNVDVVGYENINKVHDIVVSGQVLEHVKHPWEVLKSWTGYFKLYICIIVPNRLKAHAYPIDTYRYLTDGLIDLFEYADIVPLEVFMKGRDTIGIGTK